MDLAGLDIYFLVMLGDVWVILVGVTVWIGGIGWLVAFIGVIVDSPRRYFLFFAHGGHKILRLGGD